MSDEGSWAKYGSLPNSFGRKFRIDLVQKTIYVYRIYIVFIWYLYGTFMVCVWYANSMYMVCICICMWYVYGTVDIWPNMGDVYIYYQRKLWFLWWSLAEHWWLLHICLDGFCDFSGGLWPNTGDLCIYFVCEFCDSLAISGRTSVTLAYIFGWI